MSGECSSLGTMARGHPVALTTDAPLHPIASGHRVHQVVTTGARGTSQASCVTAAGGEERASHLPGYPEDLRQTGHPFAGAFPGLLGSCYQPLTSTSRARANTPRPGGRYQSGHDPQPSVERSAGSMRPAACNTFIVTSTGLSRYVLDAATERTLSTTSFRSKTSMGPAPTR